MMLPFGIQVKGFVAGLLVAYLIVPWIQRFLVSRTSSAPAT